MRRRAMLKYSLTAAAAAAALPERAAVAGPPAKDAGPVPDGRLTAPLAVPADGKIPVAFVLAADAEVVDFSGPWGVFEYVLPPDSGGSPFDLFTVAESTRPLKVSGGMTLVPDHAFSDAPKPRVIVVPAMDVDKVPAVMLDWLRAVQLDADVTMSVCNGSFVLAKAGLLDARKATAHHGGYGMLRALFPKVDVVRGARYVEDGRIATAGGLTSGIDLALRVVERYFGRAIAERTAVNLEYQGTGWKYPASNARFARKPVATGERPVCPVCEAELTKGQALQAVYDRRTYYFCGEWCRSQFLAAPRRFL